MADSLKTLNASEKLGAEINNLEAYSDGALVQTMCFLIVSLLGCSKLVRQYLVIYFSIYKGNRSSLSPFTIIYKNYNLSSIQIIFMEVISF